MPSKGQERAKVSQAMAIALSVDCQGILPETVPAKAVATPAKAHALNAARLDTLPVNAPTKEDRYRPCRAKVKDILEARAKVRARIHTKAVQDGPHGTKEKANPCAAWTKWPGTINGGASQPGTPAIARQLNKGPLLSTP